MAERAGVEEEVGATVVEEMEEVVKAAATGEEGRVEETVAAEKGGAREVVATVVEEMEEVGKVEEARAP